MRRIASMALAIALLMWAGAASAQVNQDVATEDGDAATEDGDAATEAEDAATEAANAAAEAEAALTEEEARTVFRLALLQYNSGRFAEAAEGFRRAYELSGRPALLYNLYLTTRDGGDLQGAYDALRQFLAEGGDEVTNRRLMERRLEILQQQIEAGSTDIPDTATTDTPDEAVTPANPPPPQDPQVDEPSDGGGGSALPWVFVGGGGAMLAAALVFNRLSASEQSDLDDNCPDDRCPAAYDAQGVSDSIKLYNGLGWGLLAGGVATAGLGVVLMALSSDGGDEPPVTASCGPEGCAASVRGRF